METGGEAGFATVAQPRSEIARASVAESRIIPGL
jgi:hypothetical protein